MGCQASQTQKISAKQALIQRKEEIRYKADKLIKSGNNNQALQMATTLMEAGRQSQAADIYKRIIEQSPQLDQQISGLGCKQQQYGYYQYTMGTWYKNQILNNRIKYTPYDALSLCLSKRDTNDIDQFNEWKKWYEQLIIKHPQNYQLHFGLGNLLYNQAIYQQAVVSYSKVIQLKPKFVKPYVDIALVYEYQRIQKKKSIAWASKVLAIEPNNPYAQFIIARNQQGLFQKIKRLKSIADKYPRYTRIANDIGIAYGAGLKDYIQAINWYKRCVEVYPQYYSSYNNIGVNYELMGKYTEAKQWYFKACEINPEYKAPHQNLRDVFDTQGTTDEDILQQSRNYNLKQECFCYYMGLAYYDKRKISKCIAWYKRALQIGKDNYKIYNSLAIAYDQNQDYDLAIQNYQKSIKIKPDYHHAYYNMAIVYKNKNELDSAIKWYLKATEINPRYSFAYNNLGNIYKDRNQNEDAIKYYSKAVEHNNTYTLALTNMGVCYLRMQNYKEAFNCFNRAEQILPTDNNNLSQGNRIFLKQNLNKLKNQGENWKRTGSINIQMKSRLNGLIKQFEDKFKSLYSGIALTNQVNTSKALKKQITQIVKLVHNDKFELTSIDQIFNLVKDIFHEDEQYFHIIPQLFIQYFWNHTFNKKQSIQTIESTLKRIIHSQSVRLAQLNQQKYNNQTSSPNNHIVIKCNNFHPSKDSSVNLFQESSFFSNYQQLYSEIDKVNAAAKLSLTQFTVLVQQVTKESNGIPVGTCMKIPQKSHQQFKVILRILQKMLKKEMNSERVQIIIQKIDQRLKKAAKVTQITVVHQIMQTWTNEITQILSSRLKNAIITECNISDLVRGKCMFNKVEDIAKAVEVSDRICKEMGYEIIELDNRLSKKETMDVVLKIRIREAVCEFQLAMKQDESRFHFIHSIYEIERSPLGCIFGSYLFMSKGFQYPLIANCRDIVQKLKNSTKEDDQNISKAAQYIVNQLKQQ